ncbi:MAG TPA: AIR synthase-related protein, partial [Allocoleopsis sp.]
HTPTLGGSEYLASIHHTVAGMPPIVNFDLERQVQATCREGIAQGWIKSAHDCAEGGLAVALAESCIAGQKGAEVQLEIPQNTTEGSAFRWDSLLFAEGGARILVTVAPENVEAWESYLQNHLGENWQSLGQVSQSGGSLRISTPDNLSLIDVRIEALHDRWFNAIDRRL